MTENNLTMLYGGKQFDSMTDVRDCEYTDCKDRTDKLLVIDGDVWQFCIPHFKLVLNAFCRLETNAGGVRGNILETQTQNSEA